MGRFDGVGSCVRHCARCGGSMSCIAPRFDTILANALHARTIRLPLTPTSTASPSRCWMKGRSPYAFSVSHSGAHGLVAFSPGGAIRIRRSGVVALRAAVPAGFGCYFAGMRQWMTRFCPRWAEWMRDHLGQTLMAASRPDPERRAPFTHTDTPWATRSSARPRIPGTAQMRRPPARR